MATYKLNTKTNPVLLHLLHILFLLKKVHLQSCKGRRLLELKSPLKMLGKCLVDGPESRQTLGFQLIVYRECWGELLDLWKLCGSRSAQTWWCPSRTSWTGAPHPSSSWRSRTICVGMSCGSWEGTAAQCTLCRPSGICKQSLTIIQFIGPDQTA